MKYTDLTSALSLLNTIGKLAELDNTAIEMMVDNSKELVMAKGDTILNDGKRRTCLYFIISGKARLHHVNYAGKVITWSFHFNNSQSTLKNLFIIDYNRLLPQAPGKMHIEALSDTRLIRIGERGLWDKSECGPVMEKCLQKLHEYSFIAAYERILNLLTLTARERYNHMLCYEPHLFQMFADKYLASYLGIEPQSLSRIRKNLKSPRSRTIAAEFSGDAR